MMADLCVISPDSQLYKTLFTWNVLLYGDIVYCMLMGAISGSSVNLRIIGFLDEMDEI